jgi:hypothetical protein
MRESTRPDHDARGVEDAAQPRGPRASGPGHEPASLDAVQSRILQRACGSTGTILATLSTADLDRPAAGQRGFAGFGRAGVSWAWMRP